MTTAKRVLILEEEWLIGAHIQDILRDAGYEVVGPAQSLAKAMELIAAERLDAAVTDIHIEGRSSFAAAQALQAKGVPFAFTSGLPATLPNSVAMAPVLRKPFMEEALIATVRDLLSIEQ